MPEPIEANINSVRTRAALALATNATYIALANPTAAQTTTQVQRLTKECNGLIHALLGDFANVSDTA